MELVKLGRQSVLARLPGGRTSVIWWRESGKRQRAYPSGDFSLFWKLLSPEVWPEILGTGFKVPAKETASVCFLKLLRCQVSETRKPLSTVPRVPRKF